MAPSLAAFGLTARYSSRPAAFFSLMVGMRMPMSHKRNKATAARMPHTRGFCTRTALMFFERLDVGAIDFCFANPRVAAWRAVREKEGGKQEKRRGGKHGNEHAQKAYGESQPGAGEEDGLFHEGSYRQVLHAGRREADRFRLAVQADARFSDSSQIPYPATQTGRSRLMV